jgi:cyclohexanone monooxygenase
VTPTYRAGCKRILISNAWYPALAADNVDLVTDPITKVTGDAVVTADGVERPIDVLVVATGFYVTEPPIAQHVTGRDGRTLADVWDEAGMAAYKGTTIHGFPNLFQIVGPNTALGHSSMIFMIESQVRYVVDAARAMRRQGLGAVEPSAAAQAEWTASMRERMKPTVWTTGGCASWYLDKFGNNTTLWPGQTFSFRHHLSRFDVDRYDVAPLTTAAPDAEEALA